MEDLKVNSMWDYYEWGVWRWLIQSPNIEGYSFATKSYWSVTNFFDPRVWILGTSEIITVLAAAIILTLFRIGLENLFRKVGIYFSLDESKKIRFGESCTKTILYTISFATGLWMLYEGDYFPQTWKCWIGFPNPTQSPHLSIFYLVQMGFYVHNIYASFKLEQMRSDWTVILIHHFVTLWLIYASYILKFQRIGTLILVLHDCNDVILEFGKVFVYLNYEKMKNICFTALIISWIVTRLYLFPFYAIYSTIFEVPQYAPVDLLFPLWFAFVSLLCVLFCMHLYWFHLMLKGVYKKLWLGKDVEDERDQVVIEKKIEENIRKKNIFSGSLHVV